MKEKEIARELEIALDELAENKLEDATRRIKRAIKWLQDEEDFISEVK